MHLVGNYPEIFMNHKHGIPSGQIYLSSCLHWVLNELCVNSLRFSMVMSVSASGAVTSQQVLVSCFVLWSECSGIFDIKVDCITSWCLGSSHFCGSHAGATCAYSTTTWAKWVMSYFCIDEPSSQLFRCPCNCCHWHWIYAGTIMSYSPCSTNVVDLKIIVNIELRAQ